MYTLSSIINKLVGDCRPHGDSSLDEASISNLHELGDMLSEIVYQLCDNIKGCFGHTEYSMREVSKATWNILRELRTYINDVEEYKLQ